MTLREILATSRATLWRSEDSSKKGKNGSLDSRGADKVGPMSVHGGVMEFRIVNEGKERVIEGPPQSQVRGTVDYAAGRDRKSVV